MALAGRPAGLRLPHLTFRSGTGFAAAFLYGVAYAGASLGCSLPLFAAAVARGAAASGPAGAGVAVVGYALGMGLLVAGVGQVIAWSGAAAGRRLANAGRWASALGAALTLVIGLGLVFVGLRELGLPEPAVIATAQTGVADALALSPALLAGLLGVPVVVGLVVVALRAGAQRRSGR